MQLNSLIFLSLLGLLTVCQGQSSNDLKQSTQLEKQQVFGDTVKELGSSIMLVYQDSKKVFWFGSWETGLYKYDGKTLLQFTTDHGLSNNRIDDIQEDKNGNIFFSSSHPESSVVKFDGKKFSALKSVPSNDWQLNSSDLWLKHAYRNEKVYRYDGETLHELKIPKPMQIPNSFEIYSIYKDKQGIIWFGSNPSGVCRYNGKTIDWITEEDVTEFRDEGANGVRGILEDVNGDFWFNTEFRYTVHDEKEKDFYKRTESLGSLDGIKGGNLDEYLSCVKDDNNHLWFVTYRHGVWKYDGKNITHYPVKVNSKSITTFSIYKDKQGELWLGTHENGAFRFDGKSFVPFTLR